MRLFWLGACCFGNVPEPRLGVTSLSLGCSAPQHLLWVTQHHLEGAQPHLRPLCARKWARGGGNSKHAQVRGTHTAPFLCPPPLRACPIVGMVSGPTQRAEPGTLAMGQVGMLLGCIRPV